METLHRNVGSRQRQRGVAALGIALVVLLISTVATVAVVQVGVGEQKAMANQLRAGEARGLAEAALDRGVIYLRYNKKLMTDTAAGGWMAPGGFKWAACNTGSLAPPCGDGKVNLFNNAWTAYRNVPIPRPAAGMGTMTTHYVTSAVAPGAPNPATTGVIYVISEGLSADGSGRLLVRKAVTLSPLIANRPDAPLIAAGTIGLSGTINVVANPNGGGDGVALSVWAKDNTTNAGSSQTCHIEEYLSTNGGHTDVTDDEGDIVTLCPACRCPNTADLQLSNKDTEAIDILDIDNNVGANPDATNFPDDLFQYVFGVPETSYEAIKAEATVLADCTSLNAGSTGLYWITGDCDIRTIVGSVAKPLVVVLDNADFAMNASGAFFGVVFAFEHDGGGTITVKINGGPTLYGSLLSNRNIDTSNGVFTARYDRAVLDNIAGGLDNATLAEVPGSWKDY